MTMILGCDFRFLVGMLASFLLFWVLSTKSKFISSCRHDQETNTRPAVCQFPIKLYSFKIIGAQGRQSMEIFYPMLNLNINLYLKITYLRLRF